MPARAPDYDHDTRTRRTPNPIGPALDALAAAGYGSVNLETAAVIPQEKPAVPKGTIQPMLAGVVLTVLVLAYFLMKG